MTEINNDNANSSFNGFSGVYPAEVSIRNHKDAALPAYTELHDILHNANQPLSVIIGLAELGMIGTTDELGRDDLNTILEEANKLRTILYNARDVLLRDAGLYPAQ